jgi:hypothetical protein
MTIRKWSYIDDIFYFLAIYTGNEENRNIYIKYKNDAINLGLIQKNGYVRIQ